MTAKVPESLFNPSAVMDPDTIIVKLDGFQHGRINNLPFNLAFQTLYTVSNDVGIGESSFMKFVQLLQY